ncbi:alanyl-tRNA editing protein [Burkholderia sp. Ac-20379]|nr:alanyl-tRNA editing protein [Burkholderia sp. Ac-20379]
MTIRRYFDSDALTLTTQVLACEPEAPAEPGDGATRFRVVLAETLFHPQGGGQRADTGCIGEANVLHVAIEGDTVVHVTDRAVPAGAVSIEVDAAPRTLHARLHSAGHLIAYAAATFGWRAVKGHHWPGEARVVMERDADAREMDAQALADAVDALVAAALPRVLTERDGMRMLAYGTLDASPCGGTHVADTAAVGAVTIARVKEKKGQLTVQYDVAA